METKTESVAANVKITAYVAPELLEKIEKFGVKAFRNLIGGQRRFICAEFEAFITAKIAAQKGARKTAR